jgi:hypothetical protein
MSEQETRVGDMNAATLWEHLVPTADQVVLCSFGAELNEEQSGRQLRRALIRAGFLPGSAGHLIRNSPLLRRSSSGFYRLRPFQA